LANDKIILKINITELFNQLVLSQQVQYVYNIRVNSIQARSFPAYWNGTFEIIVFIVTDYQKTLNLSMNVYEIANLSVLVGKNDNK